MRILLKKAKGKNKFYVVYKARNGKVLATSEVVNSKQAAITNVKSMEAVMMKVFDIHDETGTETKIIPYFPK